MTHSAVSFIRDTTDPVIKILSWFVSAAPSKSRPAPVCDFSCKWPPNCCLTIYNIPCASKPSLLSWENEAVKATVDKNDPVWKLANLTVHLIEFRGQVQKGSLRDDLSVVIHALGFDRVLKLLAEVMEQLWKVEYYKQNTQIAWHGIYHVWHFSGTYL